VGFWYHPVTPAHVLERSTAHWMQVGAKIQARLGAGRSTAQDEIGLLHRQPTPRSIAAAEEKVGEMWVPLEMAVAALARAREADRANDAAACEQAVVEAQRAFLRRVRG
jgi:hypothetical protein